MQNCCPFFLSPAFLRALALLSIGLLSGCGSTQPISEVSQFPKLSHDLPRKQTLNVLLLTDSRWQQLHPNHGAMERLKQTSNVFGEQFGIILRVTEVRPWSHEQGVDLFQTLQMVKRPQGVDLIMAFSGTPPPKRARMSNLSTSQYLGHHLLVQDQSPLLTSDSSQTQRLYEVRAIAHALGRIFGALPTCTPSIMSPALPPPRAPSKWWRFSTRDSALITLHVGVDRGQLTTIAQPALDLMGQLPTPPCDQSAFLLRNTLYQDVLKDPIAAALVELKAGNAKAAYTDCEAIAKKTPMTGAARCAGLAAESLGLSTEAIRNLRAHLADQPDDWDIVLRLARLVGRAGDDGAARALLTRFVQANPTDETAWINLGVSAARMGDTSTARTAWQTVLKLNSNHQDAARLLQQLR